MSKALLIIDMPENCGNCPIIDYCHNNDGKCDLKVKQSWCPLKKIPQKTVSLSMDNQYVTGRKDGWNACIDKILS